MSKVEVTRKQYDVLVELLDQLQVPDFTDEDEGTVSWTSLEMKESKWRVLLGIHHKITSV